MSKGQRDGGPGKLRAVLWGTALGSKGVGKGRGRIMADSGTWMSPKGTREPWKNLEQGSSMIESVF